MDVVIRNLIRAPSGDDADGEGGEGSSAAGVVQGGDSIVIFVVPESGAQNQAQVKDVSKLEVSRRLALF